MVREFVRIIGDQANNLNALDSNFLDVARIERSTPPVGPDPGGVAVLQT